MSSSVSQTFARFQPFRLDLNVPIYVSARMVPQLPESFSKNTLFWTCYKFLANFSLHSASALPWERGRGVYTYISNEIFFWCMLSLHLLLLLLGIRFFFNFSSLNNRITPPTSDLPLVYLLSKISLYILVSVKFKGTCFTWVHTQRHLIPFHCAARLNTSMEP